MSTKKKLLLIGAGPTSSLISYNIAKNQKLRDAFDVHVCDKARGIGGRFATSRSSQNPECYADLGAQYLTKSKSNVSSTVYFENLIKHNLIRTLETSGIPGFRHDPSKIHYACVQGTGSIVKHFFQQASIDRDVINFNCRVTKISPTSSGQLEVKCDNQWNKSFDLIVSTMPAPQILQLENASELVTDGTLRTNLESVKYSTRFALAIFLDKAGLNSSNHQALNFVENNPVVRYWSLENLKRNGNLTGPTSLVVHSSIDFGEKNVDQDKDKVKPELTQQAAQVIQEIAEVNPSLVKCHKWRYSQVLQPYIGSPGCVRIANQIYAAGDSFSGSGFESCIESAEQTLIALQNALNL